MDLSSLEGPPTLDDRFCFTISSPSPVSPMAGSATWERWEQHYQRTGRQSSIPTPISPISDNSRSFSSTPPSLPSTLRRPRRGSHGSDGGYSNHYYGHSHDRPAYQSPTASRLRSSRSFSSLQAPASVPPRPRSADNHSSSSAPRLITNGRLVWLDEQQIWVLTDGPLPQSQQTTTTLMTRDLPRARNHDTIHVAQHSSNPLIQYYDPITHEEQILRDGAMPPPSYESHRFSRGRLHPQRITIPAPQQNHHSGRPPRARTQWASVAERLGRSPLA